MNWQGPILTDSGGFQVFSLATLRKITEDGVCFSSHIDGHRIFMGPEESMKIQSHLGSTIAMAFDECIANPAEYDYTRMSAERTMRWLCRCKEELARLNSQSGTLNNKQMLFGINQGSTYEDLRIENMKRINELELDGYAIGGLAVGESAQEMYRIIDCVEPYMPEKKPRYLMGVGTPLNILESVSRGIDFFDCVMPSRNGRHGHVFTWEGKRNLINAKYVSDTLPIDTQCGCPTCQNFSRAYIHHLFKAQEMLAMRLAVMHNLYFYNTLMAKIRTSLDEGKFTELKERLSQTIDTRI
jgi:queuine tRNA-ribosyltransferase